MEKSERFLLKVTLFAKEGEVWKAWYKKAKIYVF